MLALITDHSLCVNRPFSHCTDCLGRVALGFLPFSGLFSLVLLPIQLAVQLPLTPAGQNQPQLFALHPPYLFLSSVCSMLVPPVAFSSPPPLLFQQSFLILVWLPFLFCVDFQRQVLLSLYLPLPPIEISGQEQTLAPGVPLCLWS